jgi:hypothetical protein
VLDLESALQLPRGAHISLIAGDPFGKPGAAPLHLDLHGSTIHLAPFEVRTFESDGNDILSQ